MCARYGVFGRRFTDAKEVVQTKLTRTIAVALLSAVLLTSTVAAVPRYDDMKPIYTYEDEYSTGGFTPLTMDRTIATRAYGWSWIFNRVAIARVRISDLDTEGEPAEWSSPRLAIINPDNLLERYEVRLYPLQDRLQANYVDRTGRTGDWSIDEDLTHSEVLAGTDCSIEPDRWYYTVVMRMQDKWRVTLLSASSPTCFLSWNDDRITSEPFGIGVQSAGKYLVSEFERVVGI